jgi:hypothetical protein
MDFISTAYRRRDRRGVDCYGARRINPLAEADAFF